MKTNGNFFTRIAYNFAAILVVMTFASGLSACGNSDGTTTKTQGQTSEKLRVAGSEKLRNAVAIESNLSTEDIFLGVTSYRRADAVSFLRGKLDSASDNDLLRWYEAISSYKTNIVIAIKAADRNYLNYGGQPSDLTDRRDTATAFLSEIKMALNARGLN